MTSSAATKNMASRLPLGGSKQSTKTEHEAQAAGRGEWSLFFEAFRDHKSAWYGSIILSVMAISCVALPFVLPWSATEIDFARLTATSPSANHPLGTDMLGRDVLARLLSAGRISLLIGVMVALIAAAIGAVTGLVAGYFRGKIDEAISWWINVLMTIPSLPLLIAISSVAASENSSAASIFKAVPPEWRIIIIMSLLGWMGIARIVRSQVLSLRRREFVEASVALGASTHRVLFVHILPNTISVLAVFTTLTVSTAIIGESSLSFLGLGVTPPTATWGNMLLEARDVFTAVNYWWLTWPPAIMILLTVLCVNSVGDGMRDAFDPSSR